MEIEETTWIFLGVTVGMVAYSIFAVAFYRSLHARDPGLRWFCHTLDRRNSTIGRDTATRLWEYIAIPLVVVFSALMLAVLGGAVIEGQEFEDIYAISAGIVAAVRILVYLWQEPASELAKMIPIALLSVAIFSQNSVDFDEWSSGLAEAGFENGSTYAILLILLEWGLRLAYNHFSGPDDAKSGGPSPADPGNADASEVSSEAG